VLEGLLGVRIRGPGPWAVVHDPRCTVGWYRLRGRLPYVGLCL